MSTKRLEEELKERLHIKRLEKNSNSVSGSCISSGFCYTIDNDQSIFVKTNAGPSATTMFNGELESLKQIRATRTIRVPKPLIVIHNYDESSQASAIAMEFLDIKPLSDSCARKLGQSFANLHDYNNKVSKFNKRASKWVGGKPPSSKAAARGGGASENKDELGEESADDEEDVEDNQFTKHSMRIVNDKSSSSSNNKQPSESATDEYPERFVPEPNTKEITQFGFDLPTSCGSIPQVNEWTDDWISFYARHRLDKPIRALLSDHSDRELSQQWSQLQLKVDKFFVDFDKSGAETRIKPALLHGDLWSGNVAQLSDDSQGVIYDPSSFYGHSEYDFGIARMFGGIPRAFENSYFELMPKKKLFEKRNKLYQLFHHLNHWDIFGSGYRASSLRLIKELNVLV